MNADRPYRVLFLNPEQYLPFEQEPSNSELRLPILGCGVRLESTDLVYQRVLRSAGRGAMDAAVLAAVDAAQPELVVYSTTWPHESLSPGTLDRILERGVKVLTHVWDTHIEPRWHELEWFEHCTHFAVADSVTNYRRFEQAQGFARPPQVLLTAGHLVYTDVLKPASLPLRYDVTMAGSLEGGRVGLVQTLRERLRREGFALETVGGLVHMAGGARPGNPPPAWIPLEDYARIIGQSRICLSSQTDPNRSQIKGKVFHYLACGSLCFSDRNPEIRQIVPDDCVIYYDTAEDCVAKMLHYLRHPDERDAVARRGHEWFRSTFDYRTYWADVLRKIRCGESFSRPTWLQDAAVPAAHSRPGPFVRTDVCSPTPRWLKEQEGFVFFHLGHEFCALHVSERDAPMSAESVQRLNAQGKLFAGHTLEDVEERVRRTGFRETAGNASAPRTEPRHGLAGGEGNYLDLARSGAVEDPQSSLARRLLGIPVRSGASRRTASAVHPFATAVGHWMEGRDREACDALRGVDTPHAANLLRLIEKPQIEVAAQTPWTETVIRDPKFRIRYVGPRRVQAGADGRDEEVHQPPRVPYRSLQDAVAGSSVDFYFAHMVEWQHLPLDLAQAPFPVFGVTSDFDIHIQNLLPWLSQFDELITVGPEEREKVRRLSGRPVTTFPRMFGLSPDLPALTPGKRPFDLFISGTIASPYNPDKAGLWHQLLADRSLRIRYVDGFLSPAAYYQAMAQAKVVFTYVRHPGSMPSRGLEALAMGCAVLTQETSALTLYAGPGEGVFTYRAEAGDLAARICEIAGRWPQIEAAARRGAEWVRRDFTLERCASQFLRFLTVQAAKPREPRRASGTERLHQKRAIARRGHGFSVATNQFMLHQNAERLDPAIRQGEDVTAFIECAREVDLFTSVDMAMVLATQTGTPEQAGTQAELERQRQQSTALYRRWCERHPAHLVLQFNRLRQAFHLGTPEAVGRALEVAVDMLAQPPESWCFEPRDDVYPWDYHSHFFNYRRYFDTIVEGVGAASVDRARLRDLMLASVCGYLGLYTGEARVLRRAVELDPEFPFYRLHLARALAREGTEAGRTEAAALALDLAEHSIVLEPAFQLLVFLSEAQGTAVPGLDRVEEKVRRLRNITRTAHVGSCEFDVFPLVLPPWLNRLPGATLPAASGPPRVQCGPRASHAVRRGSRSVGRILLIPFECADWKNARSWSYNGHLAFEDGLAACGVEFDTLPALAGIPIGHDLSLLKHARTLCAGRRYEQVWLWATHNDYPPEFLDWLRTVAPVRVGVVMESMEHTPEEYALYSKLPGRRERVCEQLKHLTHVLTFDDYDATTFPRDLPIRALWCPPVVPWRSVVGAVELPAPGPAVFQGMLYSPERQALLKHPALKKHLVKPSLPEDATEFPARFDRLHQSLFHHLKVQQTISMPLMTGYMDELRHLRRELLELWFEGLKAGYATVNLPSIFKGYAGRVVESMAAGRPVVSWDVPRERTRALFTPEEEILLFPKDRPEQLLEQIRRLRRDPAFARRLAENARRKVLCHHTAEIRVRQILDWLEQGALPDYGEPHVTPATSTVSVGSAPSAAATSAQRLADHPQHEQLAAVAARLAAGDRDAAIGLLQEISGAAPADPLLAGALGTQLFAAQRFTEAVDAFRRAAAALPADAPAHTQLALAAVKAGQVEVFDAALARALELDPEYRDALKLLGDLCLEQGQLANAAQAYTRILRQHPGDREVLHPLGVALFKAGELEAALEIYAELLRLDPGDALAQENAQVLRDRLPAPVVPPSTAVSATPAASATVQEPVSAPERCVSGVAALGDLTAARGLARSQQTAAAWGEGVAAVTVRPFHPEGYLWLADLAREAGDPLLARACAQRAHAMAPAWKPAKKLLKQLPVPGKTPSRSRVTADWPKPPGLEAADSAPTPRLTVCVIARNEEKFLPQCLRSVKEVAWQIVVLDTGSTDRTVEIAKELGAEVHAFVWCDDFAAAKNAALEHARGDWVLFLDADEELAAQGCETLRQEIADPRFMAYRMPITNLGCDERGHTYVPRLFRNAPGVLFLGRVHEHPFVSVDALRRPWGLENGPGKSFILHHGYEREVIIDRKKGERNLRLLELAVQEMPAEPNLRMNLGVELARVGRAQESLKQYREALRLTEALPRESLLPEFPECVLSRFAMTLLGEGQWQEVLDLLGSPLVQHTPQNATVHYAAGMAAIRLQRPELAIEQLRLCLERRRQPSFFPVLTVVTTAAPVQALGLAYAQSQRFVEAEAAFVQALAQEPKDKVSRLNLARALWAQEKAVPALETLHGLIGDHADCVEAWLLGSQIALSKPEYLEFASDWTGEAVKHLPQDKDVAARRAEVLMLKGEMADAVHHWRVASCHERPDRTAALILCELCLDQLGDHVLNGAGTAVNGEFLRWYQRLAGAGAQAPLLQINQRLGSLQKVLPAAARAIEAAMAEAGA